MNEPIKNFYGKIIGWLDRKDNGDVFAKDFYGKIIGKYIANENKTKDFYGKIIAKGDITSSLVWSAWEKEEKRLSGK